MISHISKEIIISAVPGNLNLSSFEGITLQPIFGFLLDSAILFALESKVEKSEYFGFKQGQYYPKS